MENELLIKGQAAKKAGRVLGTLDTAAKNAALETIADTIPEQESNILAANQRDMEAGKANGLSEALLDRLLLTAQRLQSISNDVRSVAGLPDPVGEEFESRRRPNGLQISKRRIPIGVIGVIYESRPNVTIDISALCLKSGNVAILRGGKESAHSNRALAKAVQLGCQAAGLPAESMQLIESTDRGLVKEMLRANGIIDMIIPRGGAALHQFAIENATVPVITGGIGICHVYVDAAADLSQVTPIVVNSKVQRPSVCNAMDTVLVHQDVALEILPQIARALAKHKVELRCAPKALSILENNNIAAKPAGKDDFDTEFMALVAALKIVDDVDDAIDHIYAHGSGHTEAIITENYSTATQFVNQINASAVMVNASTRFNDGGRVWFGRRSRH